MSRHLNSVLDTCKLLLRPSGDFYKSNWLFIVFAAGLAAYTGFMIYSFASAKAFVPDESWFLSVMGRVAHLSHMQVPNEFGYGSLWLYAYSRFSSILTMRLLSLVFFLFNPVFIFLIVRHESKNIYAAMLAVLFYLSMPLAWFSGKLIGTEIPSQFFCLAGVCLIVFKKSFLAVAAASLLVGLGVGIKLSSVPFLAFLGILCVYSDISKRRFLAVMKKSVDIVFFSSIGFLLANLYFLYDPDGWTNNLLSSFELSASGRLADWNVLWGRIDRFFNGSDGPFLGPGGSKWTWDLINNDAFFSVIVSPAILLTLAALLIFSSASKKMTLSVAVVFFVIFYMCIQAGKQLSWYLMLLPVTLAAGLGAISFKKNLAQKLAILMVLLNFVINAPTLAMILENRIRHIANYNNLDLPYFKNYAKNNPGVEILWFAEFGEGLPGSGAVPLYSILRDNNHNIRDGRGYLLFLGDRYEILLEADALIHKAKNQQAGLNYIAKHGNVHIIRKMP